MATTVVRGIENLSAPIDVMLLFPFEPVTDSIVEPAMRTTAFADWAGPILLSFLELEATLKQPLRLTGDVRPFFGGYQIPSPKQRSLGAITLATHLERAGLSWYACDPGEQSLSAWRRYLGKLRHFAPRVVGISSTFISHLGWLALYLRIVRRIFPSSFVVLGGAAYLQNPKGYLSLDGDAFCVGEGEERLPAIVRAIRDGRSLASIPGLYLPRPEGGLQYTGRVEPLNLSALPAPDWALADRIDPPRDLQNDVMEVAVETQRGCGFKCGFCTYRTLSVPTLMTPQEAARRILATGVAKSSFVDLIDATATFPWSRWNAILDLLIEAGGSPRPLWCMARVTDLHDATVERMVKANVRHVFIGQESGDQRILNVMRKGTNLKAVRPALEALARHGLSTSISFIHGYPGETTESVANTRRLLLSLNAHSPDRPPVIWYAVAPFMASQIASAAQEGKLDLKLEGEHVFQYRSGETTSRTWMVECLKTFVAVSRCSHAPASLFTSSRDDIRSCGLALTHNPHEFEVFRWMKLVERGAGMFLAQRLGEGPPARHDLEELRRQLDAFYDPRPPRKVFAVSAVWSKLITGRFVEECSREEERGPGILTRIAVSRLAAAQTGSLGEAMSAFKTASVPQTRGKHASDGEVADNLADMAKIAIDEGLEHGRIRPKMDDPEDAARCESYEITGVA